MAEKFSIKYYYAKYHFLAEKLSMSNIASYRILIFEMIVNELRHLHIFVTKGKVSETLDIFQPW